MHVNSSFDFSRSRFFKRHMHFETFERATKEATFDTKRFNIYKTTLATQKVKNPTKTRKLGNTFTFPHKLFSSCLTQKCIFCFTQLVRKHTLVKETLYQNWWDGKLVHREVVQGGASCIIIIVPASCSVMQCRVIQNLVSLHGRR